MCIIWYGMVCYIPSTQICEYLEREKEMFGVKDC
jgi:hypothetical protein